MSSAEIGHTYAYYDPNANFQTNDAAADDGTSSQVSYQYHRIDDEGVSEGTAANSRSPSAVSQQSLQFERTISPSAAASQQSLQFVKAESFPSQQSLQFVENDQRRDGTSQQSIQFMPMRNSFASQQSLQFIPDSNNQSPSQQSLQFVKSNASFAASSSRQPSFQYHEEGSQQSIQFMPMMANQHNKDSKDLGGGAAEEEDPLYATQQSLQFVRDGRSPSVGSQQSLQFIEDRGGRSAAPGINALPPLSTSSAGGGGGFTTNAESRSISMVFTREHYNNGGSMTPGVPTPMNNAADGSRRGSMSMRPTNQNNNNNMPPTASTMSATTTASSSAATSLVTSRVSLLGGNNNGPLSSGGIISPPQPYFVQPNTKQTVTTAAASTPSSWGYSLYGPQGNNNAAAMSPLRIRNGSAAAPSEAGTVAFSQEEGGGGGGGGGGKMFMDIYSNVFDEVQYRKMGPDTKFSRLLKGLLIATRDHLREKAGVGSPLPGGTPPPPPPMSAGDLYFKSSGTLVDTDATPRQYGIDVLHMTEDTGLELVFRYHPLGATPILGTAPVDKSLVDEKLRRGHSPVRANIMAHLGSSSPDRGGRGATHINSHGTININNTAATGIPRQAAPPIGAGADHHSLLRGGGDSTASAAMPPPPPRAPVTRATAGASMAAASKMASLPRGAGQAPAVPNHRSPQKSEFNASSFAAAAADSSFAAAFARTNTRNHFVDASSSSAAPSPRGDFYYGGGGGTGSPRPSQHRPATMTTAANTSHFRHNNNNTSSSSMRRETPLRRSVAHEPKSALEAMPKTQLVAWPNDVPFKATLAATAPHLTNRSLYSQRTTLGGGNGGSDRSVLMNTHHANRNERNDNNSVQLNRGPGGGGGGNAPSYAYSSSSSAVRDVGSMSPLNSSRRRENVSKIQQQMIAARSIAETQQQEQQGSSSSKTELERELEMAVSLLAQKGDYRRASKERETAAAAINDEEDSRSDDDEEDDEDEEDRRRRLQSNQTAKSNNNNSLLPADNSDIMNYHAQLMQQLKIDRLRQVSLK